MVHFMTLAGHVIKTSCRLDKNLYNIMYGSKYDIFWPQYKQQ